LRKDGKLALAHCYDTDSQQRLARQYDVEVNDFRPTSTIVQALMAKSGFVMNHMQLWQGGCCILAVAR